MLSVDNFVQDEFNTQNYNRYAYAHNNPLKYTDPDGENPILIGMAIAAVMYTGQVAISPGGFKNWDWGQFLFTTAMGAFSGGVASSIGNLELSMVGSTLVHGAWGGASSVVQGGTFISGLLAGAASSLVSSIVQTKLGGSQLIDLYTLSAGGLTGGVSSAISGGNFWDGARTGLIVAGLNHIAHDINNNFVQQELKLEEMRKLYEKSFDDFIQNLSDNGFNGIGELYDDAFIEPDQRIVKDYELLYRHGAVLNTITYTVDDTGVLTP